MQCSEAVSQLQSEDCDSSFEECYVPDERSRHRRKMGYTILKRRRRELRKKLLSFSPLPFELLYLMTQRQVMTRLRMNAMMIFMLQVK